MSEKTYAKTLSQKRAYQGFHSLDVLEIEPRSLKHDGYAPKMEDRVVLRCRAPSAFVLLYEPETDVLVLTQQFRIGPYLHGEDPFLFETVAGYIDEGETAEDAARREAVEESGCHLLDLEKIGVYYPAPGNTDEHNTLFVGRIAKAEAGIHGLEEEKEEIKTWALPWPKVLDMLDRNLIRNAPCALMFHWFARNRDRLREKWLKK